MFSCGFCEILRTRILKNICERLPLKCTELSKYVWQLKKKKKKSLVLKGKLLENCFVIWKAIIVSCAWRRSISFNRDLNRGCLVYKFSLRFSGSKFLINLRRQFRARKKFFLARKFFRTQRFVGFAVFLFCV